LTSRRRYRHRRRLHTRDIVSSIAGGKCRARASPVHLYRINRVS